MGRLLVSVRGPQEALAAAERGAHIADVEYPASALSCAIFGGLRLTSFVFGGRPVTREPGMDGSEK